MGQVTTEWMILENEDRMLSLCRDDIPIYLPNEWLMQVYRNSTSPKTPTSYAQRLVLFFKWLDLQGIKLEDITRKNLFDYRSAIYLENYQEGYLFEKEIIKEETRIQTLSCAIRFLDWAAQLDDDTPMLQPNAKRARRASRGMLRGIVSTDLEKMRPTLLKKKKRKLPKFMTDQEVDQIRDWIDITWGDNAALRIRNRAIFELLYDTGLRAGEICSVKLEGLDDDERTLLVPYLEEEYEKARKTSKAATLQKTGERVVVIGQVSVKFLNEYISLYRPREAIKYGHGRIFCTHRPAKYRGQPMTPYALNHIFDLMNRPPSEGGVGISKHVHAHLWRHTSATSIRNKGVETRVIQEQLGHKSPATTQIYDHVAPTLRRKKLDEARGEIDYQKIKQEWRIDD
jgi:site-specific recombinase XerD